MTVSLDIVVTACLLANASGLAVAAFMVWRRARFAGPRLLSFVVGVLLGAVLLDLLPHLWESTGSALAVAGLFGGAMATSLVFDRLCRCGHAPAAGHGSAHHEHPAAAGHGAEVLLVGDFMHSLVDGVLIAAALAVGVVPGALVTMAVAIHEGPRRLATVTVLLRAGYRPAQALARAVGAAGGTALGGALAWGSAALMRPLLPLALALSAAAMLYVALAQALPLLGRRQGRLALRECSLPFAAGVLIAGASHHLVELLG